MKRPSPSHTTNPSEDLFIKRLDTLKTELGTDAFKVLSDTLPESILEMTQTIQEKDSLRETAISVHEFPEQVPLSFAINSNPFISIIKRELQILQKAVHSSMQLSTSLKVWLQLNIPRIEDGNNFGVSIQETVYQELSRSEDGAMTAFDAFGRWWQVRSKLVSKILKYGMKLSCPKDSDSSHHGHGHQRNCLQCIFPSDDPTVKALLDSDQRFLGNIWMGWVDVRNSNLTLYDLISKNMEKLVNPRTHNQGNMY